LTWERIPDDPRFTDPVFPPIYGFTPDDVPCAGATSLVTVIESATTQLTASEEFWEAVNFLIGAIIGILSYLLPGIGTVIAAIVGALLVLLVNVGRAALIAGMTQAVYDQLLCIFYCWIEPDASFTEAGWLGARSQAQAEIADVAANVWISVVLTTLGPVGMTNGARVAPSNGDCSACSCEPCDEGSLYYYSGTEWVQAGYVGPNRVRAFSFHNTFTNSQSVSITWGPNGNPNFDCCTVRIAPDWEGVSDPRTPWAQETLCNGDKANHSYTWPNDWVCCAGIAFTRLSDTAFVMDFLVNPGEGCE
jgi:hypothetical protein